MWASKAVKVAIPATLQKELMGWCHKNLKHLGGDHVHLTLKQHFHWKGVKGSVKSHVKNCETCQLNKLPKKNYDELPLKDNVLDMVPWKGAHAGTIGPWETSVTEHQKGKRGKRKKIRNKVVTTHAMTMTDEATSWPEIVRIDDKTSYETSKVFDWELLCRCPRPEMTIHGNGTKFAREFQETLESHGTKSQPIAVENPRPNLVKRMH